MAEARFDPETIQSLRLSNYQEHKSNRINGSAAYVYPHPRYGSYAVVKVYKDHKPIEIGIPHKSLGWLYKSHNADAHCNTTRKTHFSVDVTDSKIIERFQKQLTWRLTTHPFAACLRLAASSTNIKEVPPLGVAQYNDTTNWSPDGFPVTEMRCKDILNPGKLYTLRTKSEGSDRIFLDLLKYGHVHQVFGFGPKGVDVSDALDELHTVLLENTSDEFKGDSEESSLKRQLLLKVKQFHEAVCAAANVSGTFDTSRPPGVNRENFQKILAPIYDLAQLAQQIDTQYSQYKDQRWQIQTKRCIEAALSAIAGLAAYYLIHSGALLYAGLGMAAAIPVGLVVFCMVGLVLDDWMRNDHASNAPPVPAPTQQSKIAMFTLFAKKAEALVAAVGKAKDLDIRGSLRAVRAGGAGA